MNHPNNPIEQPQRTLSLDQQKIANETIAKIETADWQGRLLSYIGQRFENARWAIMVDRLAYEKDMNGEKLDDGKLALLLDSSPQSIGRWKKGTPASDAKRHEIRELYDARFDDAPLLKSQFDEILNRDKLVISPQFRYVVQFKGRRMATGMAKHVMNCRKKPRRDGDYANAYKEIGDQEMRILIKAINEGWTPDTSDGAFEPPAFATIGSPEYIEQGTADKCVLDEWGLAGLVATRWIFKNKVSL